MELEFNLSTLVPMILGQKSHVCISDNVKFFLYMYVFVCKQMDMHMCMYVCVHMRVCMYLYRSVL